MFVLYMKQIKWAYEMKNLLAEENSYLNLDMLSGQLKCGEQIWIYHHSGTNPCNPVACMNPYAHVVIYIGKTGDIHEVVHISTASVTRGLLKARIRRQNVMEVIKPRDQIFLGHKIPDCEVSANLHPRGNSGKALKCTEKPIIVLDYHYRYEPAWCMDS